MAKTKKKGKKKLTGKVKVDAYERQTHVKGHKRNRPGQGRSPRPKKAKKK